MTQGLVAGLSPGKLDFSIWVVCVGFLVGKVTLPQFFCRKTSVSSCYLLLHQCSVPIILSSISNAI